MINILEPDPENLNQEEEEEITYRLQEAMHDFVPGEDGKCIEKVRKYCPEHKVSDFCRPCGLEQYSVLHWDAPSYNHCGDYDCMHFEDREY
jgi:hypothetical protein